LIGKSQICLASISPKTAKRDWSVARAWLYGQLAS
jgi:hypothetical protein